MTHPSSVPAPWSQFSPTERAVICFVTDGPHVLLIHKKRGLGEGKINGPGGRVDPGETPIQAAVRETSEEVGLTVVDLEERATLQFTFTNGYLLEVVVFVAGTYSGDPIETDEAKPFWARVDQLPFDRMWADDRLWLPHALDGRYVRGRFVFDDDEMLFVDMQTEEP